MKTRGQPGHRTTTAHVQAAYPFVAEGGLPCSRVYIGRDLFGFSFVFDPWQLYQQRIIIGIDMLVSGMIGRGKKRIGRRTSWPVRYCTARKASSSTSKVTTAPSPKHLGTHHWHRAVASGSTRSTRETAKAGRFWSRPLRPPPSPVRSTRRSAPTRLLGSGRSVLLRVVLPRSDGPAPNGKERNPVYIACIRSRTL